MALRRPILLFCIVSIVLGVNYEISRAWFPDDTDHDKHCGRIQAPVINRENPAFSAEVIEKQKPKASSPETFQNDTGLLKSSPETSDGDKTSTKRECSVWNSQNSTIKSEEKSSVAFIDSSFVDKKWFIDGESTHVLPQDFCDLDPALSVTCSGRHHHQDEIPHLKVLPRSPDERPSPSLLSDELTDLQAVESNYNCPIKIFRPGDENVCFSARKRNSSKTNILKVWNNRTVLIKKKRTCESERQLSLVCLCITLMFFRNEELKQKVMAPMFHSFQKATSLWELIQEFLQKISETTGFKGLSFHHDISKQAASGPPSDHKKDRLHSQENKGSNFAHISKFYSERPLGAHSPHTTNPVDDEDKPGKTTAFKASSWLTDFTFYTPRRPMYCCSLPISFFPSMGSSPKDNMSHLGCRLASLHSLPASCNTSRVRLAEAGFYYNSKTSRDASNAHEVTCYSCGVTYSQWKAGDNPTEIHQKLKPDCHHLSDCSRSISNSSLSSMLSNGSASMSSSSGSSGTCSMEKASLSSSLSTMSSDYTSDRSCQTSSRSQTPTPAPDERSGPGATAPATQRVVSSAPRTDSAVDRNNSM